MWKLLRALIVEDSEDDALLLVRKLEEADHEVQFERVETPEDMKMALERQEWDIVFCDYKMPRFSAPDALDAFKEKKVDIPFIVVSGTVGEDLAVETMRAGANDYIMKDNLLRLVADVRRELREAEARRAGEHAVQALHKTEEQLRTVVTNMPVMLDALDENGHVIVWNKECERVTGFKAAEVLGNPQAMEVLYPDRQSFRQIMAGREDRRNDWTNLELDLTRKDGAKRTVAWSNVSNRFPIPGWASWAVGVDVTERKRAERELQESLARLARILEETVASLAQAVEHRDPYTAGHQKRVSQLACAIAGEMGIDGEHLTGLRLAASIHDVGKLYVPAEILALPRKLNEHEYSMIQRHPVAGHDILKGVEFPWPVADIVLQHHERMDGSGYPGGLFEDDILIEARIIGVADVVEAMASHRPYRPARGIRAALAEIEAGSGTSYDPQVVDACLTLFRERDFQLETMN